MNTQANFTLRGRNPDVLTCIANLSNDEVFTPPEFANRMLDTLAEAWAANHHGANIWADKTVKFLDPCTKSGVFLREITRRLTTGLEQEIPNLEKRVNHQQETPMPKKKSPNSVRIRNSTAEFLTFAYQTGGDGVKVRVQDGTIWLSQKNLGLLFETTPENVLMHLKNIFAEKELAEDSVAKVFLATAADGKNYRIKHYHLDAIIAVGYRVNSKRATAFRQWATGVLRDYTLRGYVMDRKRMENGAFLDEDYFERLLEEIREIRLSERRFYQKIADIYATALDYDRDAPITQAFFAKVQNKMHYAVHGHTAAELIVKRADHTKERMGLTTWAKAPGGKILKSDVVVAKNYLTEAEFADLGRIVSAYLDLAESRAKRRVPMTMEAWAKRLDIFLSADERKVLQDAGRISAEIAREHAEGEFEKYRVIQDRLFHSDFDTFAALEKREEPRDE